jgi:CheY-like chemotaxis protein
MDQVSRKLVLLVDDDPGVRRLMLKVLQHPTVELVAVGSAEEALELMQERWPAVLVVDYMLPGMTGPELVKQVREDMREMAPPAVLVTGSIERVTMDDRTLFTRVIEKPFRVEVLRPVVLRLAGWRSKQRSATVARPSLEQMRDSGESKG